MTDLFDDEPRRPPPTDPPQPPLPRSRRLERLGITLSVVVALCIAAIVALVLYQHHRVQVSDALRAKRDAQISALAQRVNGGQDLAKQIRTTCKTRPKSLPHALCAKASSVAAQPSVTAGQQGPQGVAGPGPSAAQVQYAVDLFCANHSGCRGVPSKADVAAAVQAYCATGVCRGPVGESGSPGPSGASGQPGSVGSPGATGPGPSSDDIANAVAAYCSAHGSCTGPAGPKGDTGATGPAGRGIASIDCTGLGINQLTVHYSDGTTQTVPCNAPQPSGGTPS